MLNYTILLPRHNYRNILYKYDDFNKSSYIYLLLLLLLLLLLYTYYFVYYYYIVARSLINRFGTILYYAL